MAMDLAVSKPSYEMKHIDEGRNEVIRDKTIE